MAAIVIVFIGIHLASGIIGPVFLAIVLSIMLSPARNFLVHKKWPRPIATGVVFTLTISILLVGVWTFYLMATELIELLPTYEAAFTDLIESTRSFMINAGINIDAVELLKQSLNFEDIKNLLTGMLSGLASLVTAIIFLVSLLLFMSLDADGVISKLLALKDHHATMRGSFIQFAGSTRKFLVVTTIFGAGIALLDVLVLYIMGIPLPWLWGLLAFATNFIPNIGFVIGLVPPALLALLGHDFTAMVVLIVTYSVINIVFQSLLQPKVVGQAVGMNLTISFLSLIVWAWILGPIGAVLAVPLTLFVLSLTFSDPEKYSWARVFVDP